MSIELSTVVDTKTLTLVADILQVQGTKLRTSAPTLENDMVWFERSGSGPYEITLNVRIAGATYTVPLATVG